METICFDAQFPADPARHRDPALKCRSTRRKSLRDWDNIFQPCRGGTCPRPPTHISALQCRRHFLRVDRHFNAGSRCRAKMDGYLFPHIEVNMSSDLSIKINVPLDRINRDLLLQDAERIFREILNVDFTTSFCFWDPGTIILTGTDHGVYVGDLEVDPCPPWITTEAGIYAFVDTGGIYSLPWAVAASVGLALAYEYRTNIIDDGSRWVRFPNPAKTCGVGCPANVFQLAVSNSSKFSDLELAADDFYSRLPVSVNPTS